MVRSFLFCSLLGVAIAACAGDTTTAPLVSGPTALAARSGSSGSSTATITMGPTTANPTLPADIAPLTDPAGGPVLAAVNAKAPFKNLALANVSVTLNSATGDVSACKQPGSTRTYSSSFGDNTGTWTGELDVWQGRTAASSNFKFNGSRTVNGVVEVVQFTANDQDAVQTTNAGGSTELRFDAVPMGFGSQSTHFDTVDGLPVLRCLRVSFTAAS